MKKLLYVFWGAMVVCGPGYSATSDLLPVDTSDPLYMLGREHFLSETNAEYGNDILRLGQSLSYGINDRLNINANVQYQFDFVDARKERGFSGVELGGVYRAGLPGNNSADMSTDILFGARFAGNRHVREPGFAKSTYFAGVRVGRQFAGLSLAGTVKSTWVFDDTRGMSFLDFTPEIYFRMIDGWRLGTALTARVATDPDFDREWLKLKLVKQFGRTQYVAMYSYEFEQENSTVGLQVNVLF